MTRNRLVMAAVLLVLLVTVGALAAIRGSPAGDGSTPQVSREIASNPLIPAYTLQGRAETINVAVQPVLFFATWCPHCRADLPQVQAQLITLHRPTGIILVTTFDRSPSGQEVAELRAFVQRYHITMPVVLQADPTAVYVTAVPTLVWVDRALREGFPTKTNLQQALDHGRSGA